MPEGMRCSTVFLPAITSVWPALWPPWKRTTPCARSVSQSTILPLPSSPHCVPITTTLRALMLLPLPPCEGGREPKVNGGFGLFEKGKPPAHSARFPPSQGGGKNHSSHRSSQASQINRKAGRRAGTAEGLA